MVPPAFAPSTPSAFFPISRNWRQLEGGLGLRCNGRSRPSYDGTGWVHPCESDAPGGESGGDFAALPATLHQPAALWKGVQLLVSGYVNKYVIIIVGQGRMSSRWLLGNCKVHVIYSQFFNL